MNLANNRIRGADSTGRDLKEETRMERMCSMLADGVDFLENTVKRGLRPPAVIIVVAYFEARLLGGEVRR